jgi:tRNA G18 (ribose-2'-O)-methylase SpoU
MPEHEEEDLGLCKLRQEAGPKDVNDSHHEQNATLSTTTRRPKIYLVIHNIQKRPNVRNLMCTAAAFGCHGVFVVGQKNFNLDPIMGHDIPTQLKPFLSQEGGMLLKRFDKWAEFVQYIATTRQIRLIGVEIHKDAKVIDDYLSSGDWASKDIAFLMGNEGQGLSKKQQDDCHGFVRIPQYGNGTSSLNVNVAASIILQRVYQWQQHATNPVS